MHGIETIASIRHIPVDRLFCSKFTRLHCGGLLYLFDISETLYFMACPSYGRTIYGFTLVEIPLKLTAFSTPI